MDGRLWIDGPVTTEVALAAGKHLRAGLDDNRPASLYMAPLTGESLVAGAWQRAQDALSAPVLEQGDTLRRTTGGILVGAGDGIIYAALALHDESTLMRCPPRAILNRNVRGVLQGLRAAGAETNYFGRDYLTFGVFPGVYVGWARDQEGRILLEFFIAHGCDFRPPADAGAYPPLPEPPFRGRTPTCLDDLGARSFHFGDIAGAIAASHATQFDLSWQESHCSELAVDDALRECRLRQREDELLWSGPHAEAIGFLAAGVALDDAGVIADLRLAGDFMQSDASEQLLAERARGGAADDATLVELINGVYGADDHLIEGIRDMSSVLTVIRQAVALAR